MDSQEVCSNWRLICAEFERHEVVCQAEADKFLDALKLPDTRSRWKIFLANAFDRGSCYGVRNYDSIKASVEKHMAKAAEPDVECQAEATKPVASKTTNVFDFESNCDAELRQMDNLYSIQLFPLVEIDGKREGMFLGGLQFRIVDGKPVDLTTDATEWNSILKGRLQEANS